LKYFRTATLMPCTTLACPFRP